MTTHKLSQQPPSTIAKPFDIAIIGGGIGGLALCIGLLKQHIPVHVYEAAPAFAEIGAGVSFGANARRAMSLIDPAILRRYEVLATHNQWPEKENWWFEFRMGMDGQSERNKLKAGERFFSRLGAQESIHRAHFLDALVSLIPEGTATFGKKVEEIEETIEGVLLKFADGTTARATAAIGCDGVKSRTRTIVLGEDAEHCKPQFTGKYAYRGLIPMDIAAKAIGDELALNSQMHWGYNGHLLTFPIEKGKTMNVVAFRTEPKGTWDHDEWVLPMKKEQMYGDFEGWGEDVQQILQLMQKPDLWSLHNHPPARTYFRKGKIALLGDCAHASTPHQGAGAGMAIGKPYLLVRAARTLALFQIQGKSPTTELTPIRSQRMHSSCQDCWERRKTSKR